MAQTARCCFALFGRFFGKTRLGADRTTGHIFDMAKCGTRLVTQTFLPRPVMLGCSQLLQMRRQEAWALGAPAFQAEAEDLPELMALWLKRALEAVRPEWHGARIKNKAT